jgi:stress-induced morphogen
MDDLQIIRNALANWTASHDPKARTDAVRMNTAAIAVRVISDVFKLLTRSEQHQRLASFLRDQVGDTYYNISWLLTLSPEQTSSAASLFFDNLEHEK